MDNQTEFHVSEKGPGCSPLKAGVHPTDEMISNSLSQMSNVPTLPQKRKFSETSEDESDDDKRQKIEENAAKVEKPTSDDQTTDSPTFNEVKVETDKDKVDVPYLYRLLRDGELQRNGISAKNKRSTTSIAEHVAHGSDKESKYISTSTSESAVDRLLRLKKRSKYSNGCKEKIKIDVSCLPSTVQIIDLRTEEKRKQHIIWSDSTTTVGRYHKYAYLYDEVLLVGDIPIKCIQII